MIKPKKGMLQCLPSCVLSCDLYSFSFGCANLLFLLFFDCIFVYIKQGFPLGMTNRVRDSDVMGFNADEFSLLVRMHAMGRKCFEISLNCFVLLFKILIAFFM